MRRSYPLGGCRLASRLRPAGRRSSWELLGAAAQSSTAPVAHPHELATSAHPGNIEHMAKRQVFGHIELPSELYVAEDALGTSHVVRLEDFELTIRLPRIDKTRDTSTIALTDPMPNETNVWRFGDRAGWGYCGFVLQPDGSRHSFASHVRAVGLEAMVEADALEEPPALASRMGRQFDVWLALFYEWLELWSVLRIRQRDVEPMHSRGQVFDHITDPPATTGWSGPLGMLYLYPAETALSGAMVKAAAERASAAEQPPPQWSLYARARRITDTRQAVIEAATASEVAMIRAVHGRFSASSPTARDLIIHGTNGVVGLINLLEAYDGTTRADSLAGRVKGQLAGLRNAAVHRGQTPAKEDSDRAVEVAKDLLDRYTPLDQPAATD